MKFTFAAALIGSVLGVQLAEEIVDEQLLQESAEM